MDMKSSQTVMKQRCRELGLFVYGDKQALLARIVNEENRLTTDRQVTAEIKGDFERCSELRQWYQNHSGECPSRKSVDNTEATLANWLDRARSRRYRAHADTPSGRMLTAAETAHLNNIMAAQRPNTQRPKPSSSERWRQQSTKDEIERCKQLRNWYINHSGKRPRQSRDDKTEASLALWLKRALMRRTRAVNNRPCLGQLTTKETARLNSILGSTKGNFDKRCNQLRQWYTKKRRHPSRKSDDNTEVSLAVWVNHARRRRTRAITNHPSGRQFTASETAQLNSILALANKSRSRGHPITSTLDQQAVATEVDQRRN